MLFLMLFAPMIMTWNNNKGIIISAFVVGHHHYHASASTRQHTTTTVSRPMGFLDSISNFLQDRGQDFIKLDETEDAFGPGPVLILYQIPPGVDNEEIYDMLGDVAPKASAKGVALARIQEAATSTLLELTVADVLQQVISEGVIVAPLVSISSEPCPILYFSGFDNSEMMAMYNTLGKEIYDESGGTSRPACAKAVPNAMQKPLKQVLEEISGDHTEARGPDESSKIDYPIQQAEQK